MITYICVDQGKNFGFKICWCSFTQSLTVAEEIFLLLIEEKTFRKLGLCHGYRLAVVPFWIVMWESLNQQK